MEKWLSGRKLTEQDNQTLQALREERAQRLKAEQESKTGSQKESLPPRKTTSQSQPQSQPNSQRQSQRR